MVRKLIAPVMLGLMTLLAVLPASAGDYYNGYTTPAGYVYRDGYFYSGATAYTRAWVAPVYTGYCGSYVPGYWSYTVAYPAVATYVAPAVPAYTPGWKEEVIKYAKARDDQQAYLNTLAALGIQGQQYGFQQSNFYPSFGGGYGYNKSANLGSYGANGNTLYGYSFNAVKEAYGSTDMNVLYQQASRLTQGAQSLAGDANAGFATLVQEAGTNQARIAEIFAKMTAAERTARAAAELLKAAEPQPRSTTTVTGSGVGVGPNVPPPIPNGANMPRVENGGGNATDEAIAADTRRFMKEVATPKCALCHSGKDAKGKFDVSQYPGLSVEDKAKVWARILSPIAEKRMPQGPNGPGTPLTAQEVQDFVQH